MKRHPYHKLNMSRYAVSVSRNGAIEWSNPSRAFQRLREQIDENGRDTEKAKQKAVTHSDEWEERAANCEKKGMQTDHLGNMTVILSHQDCLTMAEIWRHLGLNMTTMREIMKMVTPIPQFGVRFKMTPGSIGTYENLERLEGNYDLLTDWEDKTDFVDAQDESTWPIFLRRECAGTPLDVYRDCGHCLSENIVIDEYRGEAYCNDCGSVVSDPNAMESFHEGYEIELDPHEQVVEANRRGKEQATISGTSGNKRYGSAAVAADEFLVVIETKAPPREIIMKGVWVTIEIQHPLTGKTHRTPFFFIKEKGDSSGRVSNPAHRTWMTKKNSWRRPDICLDPRDWITDDGVKVEPVFAEPFKRKN